MANLVIDAIAAVGVASSTLVTVELTDGRGDPVVGYVTGTDNVIVLPTTVTTDENGEVTIDLIPTADIVPGNTCYTVRIAHKQFLIQKSGTTENLFEALVNDPGDLDPINTDFLLKANNLSDVEDPAEARDNLGLGDAATKDVGTASGTVAAGDDARFDIAPDHIANPTDAHDATAISFTPTVSIPADDVQEAIEYVMDNASGGGGTNDHNLLINRDAADQHPASSVTNTPAGSIAATTVQGAINELDGDIQGHITDTVDAHDASAISAVPFSTITATDVQSALQQVYTAAVSGLDEASEISFAPTGDIVATNVQAAIVEVDGELHAHEALATDAHAASAISFVPTAGITSTNAQTAIVEALNDSIAYTDGAAVPKNGSYAATSTSVVRSRVTADTNPRWEVLTDGKHQWGDGTAVADTNLFRHSADILKTDDTLQVDGNSSNVGGVTLASGGRVSIAATAATSASNTMLQVGSTGALNNFNTASSTNGISISPVNAGSGDITGLTALPVVSSTGGTTSSVRGVVGAVRQADATGTVTTGRAIQASTPTVSAGGVISTLHGVDILNQGTTGVTNAIGLNVVAQSGASSTNVGVRIGAATTRTLHVSSDVNSTTAAGGITFGSSSDTNLYRAGADLLKTDDSLTISGSPTASTPTAFINPTVTTLGGVTDALNVTFTLNNSATETNIPRAHFVQLTKQGAGDATGTLRGAQCQVVNSGAGNITEARGLMSFISNGSTGTITTANSLFIASPSAGAGNPITNAYGLHVEAQTAAGVTNGYGVAIQAAKTNTLWVSSNANNTTATAGIFFGSSADTNLYRSAADTLKTDDAFSSASVATGFLSVTSGGAGIPASAGVIRIPNNAGMRARNAANTGDISFFVIDASDDVYIQTDGVAGNRIFLSAAGHGVAIHTGSTATLHIAQNTDPTTAAGGITFGTSSDTNLYRSAADTLKTDDNFIVGGNLTITDAKNIILNATTGTKIGTATTEKLGFHNATPVIQRAGAAQAAVATTAATNVTPFGYTTAAQADSIVTLLNEIRATLVEKGLMKGAA